MSCQILMLPGWKNSGPDHWQSRWGVLFGDRRVQQSDWEWPRRGDWMAQLEAHVLEAQQPCLLAAHSLGCHLVSAWAAHSQHKASVVGALLVAPPDTERADMPPQLFGWRPMIRQTLPFPAVAVVSSNDPFASLERSAELVADWGASLVQLGALGHINGESSLGDWPDGRSLLDGLRPTS